MSVIDENTKSELVKLIKNPFVLIIILITIIILLLLRYEFYYKDNDSEMWLKSSKQQLNAKNDNIIKYQEIINEFKNKYPDLPFDVECKILNMESELSMLKDKLRFWHKTILDFDTYTSTKKDKVMNEFLSFTSQENLVFHRDFGFETQELRMQEKDKELEESKAVNNKILEQLAILEKKYQELEKRHIKVTKEYEDLEKVNITLKEEKEAIEEDKKVLEDKMLTLIKEVELTTELYKELSEKYDKILPLKLSLDIKPLNAKIVNQNTAKFRFINQSKNDINIIGDININIPEKLTSNELKIEVSIPYATKPLVKIIPLNKSKHINLSLRNDFYINDFTDGIYKFRIIHPDLPKDIRNELVLDMQ